jgi:hypothetical protein
MLSHGWSQILAGPAMLVMLASAAAMAQSPKPPDTYVVTTVNELFGPARLITTYRDGARAVQDRATPPGSAEPRMTPIRTFYDLQAHTDTSWDPSQAAPVCGSGTFSGDWGDPFDFSAQVVAEIMTHAPKNMGTEKVNGFQTKILEASDPAEGKFKAWIDIKSGLLIKLETTDKDSPTKTATEVKQMSLARPPASIFAIPASCTAAAAKPSPDEERINRETGGHGANFADATKPPASKNSCTVVFRVVGPVSMQPLTTVTQVMIDRNPEARAATKNSSGGETTALGGGRDVTASMHNGTLRIENAPPEFSLDVRFKSAGFGGATATMYRQCPAPESALYLVLKNPDNAGEGADWLWEKAH